VFYDHTRWDTYFENGNRLSNRYGRKTPYGHNSTGLLPKTTNRQRDLVADRPGMIGANHPNANLVECREAGDVYDGDKVRPD
jgi:hypothetical protein